MGRPTFTVRIHPTVWEPYVISSADLRVLVNGYFVLSQLHAGILLKRTSSLNIL